MVLRYFNGVLGHRMAGPYSIEVSSHREAKRLLYGKDGLSDSEWALFDNRGRMVDNSCHPSLLGWLELGEQPPAEWW